MSIPRLANERGMALAVAVFALVVVGALVAGVFFAGHLEQRSGRNSLYAAQASQAADAGVDDALAGWDPATFNTIAVGGTATLPSETVGGNGSGVSYTQTVQRLTESLFLLRTQGRRTAGNTVLAQHSVGVLARLAAVDVDITAGLTALGDIVVGGNANISGHDRIPTAWSSGVSCPTPDSITGIRYNGTLKKTGSATITGQPDTLFDPTLTVANALGGSSFQDLKALRTLTLSGNVVGLAPQVIGDPPVCNTALQNNWGAPTDKTHKCFNYFPIVYKQGDLSISGTGAGQGVLLVEGNLTAQGRIDFYGPVIVTGAVDIRGTGSDDVKFYGGIIAQDVLLDDSKLNGNATVNYSSCAVARALQGSARGARLAHRSWAELY